MAQLADQYHAGRYVITADWLIDGSGGPSTSRPAVSVEAGRIVAVESRRPEWVPRPGFRVVDLAGASILPGLIDAHIHLGFAHVGQQVQRQEIQAAAVARAEKALAGGVTTVRDLGSVGGSAMFVRDTVFAGQLDGPRVVAADVPITTLGGHLHWFGIHAETISELRGAVSQLADSGADVVKLMVTGGNATPGSDPYTPQYAADQVSAVVEEAHQRSLQVAAHVLCTAGVRTAIEGGVDTIEHGWTITGRRQDHNTSVIQELAESRIIASVTTHEDLRRLLRSNNQDDLAELHRRLAPHRAMFDAGVDLVVHSDAGLGPTRFDRFCESVAVFQRGLGVAAPEAIRAATSLPARALGLSDVIGRVRVGFRADLLVVEGDAGKDITALERVRQVHSNGRLVYSSPSCL